MCFVWISEQTAIISLYNINWLVFITETQCVYCAVRTGYLNIINVNLVFTWLGTSLCWTVLFHQSAPYLRSASALAFFTVLITRLRNVKFDKESPARWASTLNIQTVLPGVVSLFSCIVEPYSLQMTSRDVPPREMSSKRRKFFHLNDHFALYLLRVYCRRGPNVSVGLRWSQKLG